MYQTSIKNVLADASSGFVISRPTPHPSVQSKFKRGLDIFGSLIGLIILAIGFIPIAFASFFPKTSWTSRSPVPYI